MKKVNFLILAIVFIGIGYGVFALTSGEITYKSTTVEDAIDDLYTKANKEILDKLEFSIRAGGCSTTLQSQADFGNIRADSDIKKNYKYFKVSDITKSNENNRCYPIAYSYAQSSWLDIQTDTEYTITDYNNIGLKMYSYQNSTWSTCSMKITFYNK